MGHARILHPQDGPFASTEGLSEAAAFMPTIRFIHAQSCEGNHLMISYCTDL